jgi:hypothetical protein
VRLDPTVAGSGEAVFVIERSALAITVVVAVAELFDGSGSLPSVELTVAVFESGPAAVGVTTTVAVADVPGASVPRSQVSVAVPEQEPAETSVTPPGSVSWTVAFAASGPALEATIV